MDKGSHQTKGPDWIPDERMDGWLDGWMDMQGN